MALTKRSGKGSSLTYAEMDANFTHLGGDGSYQFPATDGTANYVLATDGSGQLSFVPDVGLTTLNDLTDTTITSVANDEFLKYNGTAWINSSVAFSDLATKPTTISGYGITDALALGTTSTTALAGDTALLQLGTTSTTALAGDTSLLAIGTTSTTALAGDTSLLAIGTSSTTALAGDTALSAIGGSLDLSSQVTGTLPVGNMAATALTTIQTAATQAAQLALTTEEGDVVVRTDENKTYMRNGGTADPHDMTNFTLLATPTDAVTSVDGNTGVVTTLQIGTSATTALAGNTALLQLGTSSTTALAGDTALLALGTTSTTALAGDTAIPDVSNFITASSSDTLTNKSIAATQLTGTIDNARLPSAATSITSVGTLTNLIIQPPSGSTGGILVHSRGGNASFLLNGVGVVGDADYVPDGIFYVNNAASATIISDSNTITGPTTVNSDSFEVVSTTDDATINPTISLYRNRANPAADDDLGAIQFYGQDDGGNKTLYAQIHGFAQDETDGTEDGEIHFSCMAGASFEDPVMKLTKSYLQLNSNNDLILGQNSFVRFETDGNDAHETTLYGVQATQDNTVLLPDASGTLALTSELLSLGTTNTTALAGDTVVDNLLLEIQKSSNTLNSGDKSWLKVATVTIDARYEYYSAQLAVVGTGAAEGVANEKILAIRVKQQADMGNAPLVDIDIYNNGNEDYDFGHVVAVNSGTETRVDIYFRPDGPNSGAEVYKMADTATATVAWSSTGNSYATSAPANFVQGGAHQQWHSGNQAGIFGSLNGLLKANGSGVLSAAVAGTDYSTLALGTSSTTALAGDTALLALGTSSTTALAGDTALLALGTSSTTALAGNTTFSTLANSSTATDTITIGASAQSGAIAIGNSTAAQTINIAGGSTAGGTTNTVNIASAGGTGSIKTVNIARMSATGVTTNILMGNTSSSATSNITITGNTTINSALSSNTVTIGGTTQTGTITLGRSTKDNTINIGNGATESNQEQIINIGSGTGSGTSTVNIAAKTSQGNDTAVTIGGNDPSTGTCTVAINGATTFASGDINFNGYDFNVTPYTAAKTITLGSTTGTGTITLGRSTQTQMINIGTGTVASSKTKTINIGTGNSSGSTTNINIGPTNTSATRAIDINGNLTVDGTAQFDHMVTFKSDASTSGVYDQLVSFQAKGGNTTWYEAARIATLGSGSAPSRMIIGQDNAAMTFFDGFGSRYIYPAHADTGAGTNGVCDLGSYSNRWKLGRFSSGVTTSSDRNEKRDIEELTAAELRVAVRCKPLLRKYRRIDAYEEKGEAARIHFGIIAQDLDDAFTAEGLDAHRYAMFMEDTWYEYEGGVVTYPTLEDIPEEHRASATEHTAMGVRYEQLLAFMIAAL